MLLQKWRTAESEDCLAQEDIDALKHLRSRMIEQRRALASRDADLGYSDTRTQNLVTLQAAIEAVDRAIKDEEANL